MQRLLGSVRNIGFLAVAAGAVGEFCLYDGMSFLFLLFQLRFRDGRPFT